MTILPDALWRENLDLSRICDALGADAGNVRLVGGAVRDGLLGIDVNDIDLATRHSPQAVIDCLTQAGIKAVATGLAHGTITAVVNHHPYEITTLRRDVSTDGRHATVAFTDQWEEDAARRDFTINALYADPLTGEIYDYFEGLKDLQNRCVRFIGDACERIAEDHLRILRYFRFLARFGALPPEDSAYGACVEMASSLMALSRERIADEVMKLLALPDPLPVLRLMVEGGIFVPVVPEIDASSLNRLEKLMEREKAAGFGPVALLRLSALLPQDAAVADKVAARLKLSNKARKRISLALAPPPAHANIKELAFRIGTEGAVDLLLLQTDLPAEEISGLMEWEVPEFPVNGAALIAMGISPGPDIARMLGLIRDRWIADSFPPKDVALEIAEQLVQAEGADLSRQ